MKNLNFVLLFVVGFIGCSDSENPFECKPTDPDTSRVDQAQLQKDIETIDKFLEEKNVTAVKHPSGLRYVITKAGQGNSPNLCNQVSVTYEGRLLSNNEVFDSNSKGVVFGLNRLILGWQIGFGELKKGETATLYIPSGLGYGASGTGSGSIPGNANLVFDVSLIDFR